MELMAMEKPLEFKHGEVTFLVKPKASAADKFAAMMAKDPHEFARVAMRRMVMGWSGVTSGGKPVVYAPDLLDQLPPHEGGNPLVALGEYIVKHTDIAKVDEKAKNG